MLEVVLVRSERLRGVERRINIDQLHLAHVLLGQLGHPGERFEDVAGFAEDQKVVALRLKVGALGIIELLRLLRLATLHVIVVDEGVGFTVARVRRIHPRVTVLADLGGDEGFVLVVPGQLEALLRHLLTCSR